MPLDPRIALQAIGIEAPDFLGAMRQGQEIRQNQMAAQRRADAQAALNAMRQPVSPAMQPGSVGPAITGGPLPSVNAMGAGAPPPAAVVAPAAPANAARDMSPLYQYLDIPEIKNYVDEMNRQETARVTAANTAVDNARLGDAATRDATNFTEGYIAQAASRIASVNGDPATVARELAWLRSIPGVNPAIVDGLEARVADMPPEELAGYARNYSFQYSNSRAASQDLDPDMTQENTGSELGYRNMNPRSPGYGETAFTRPATLSPAGQAADTRADEENAREDARILQRRWDVHDAEIAAHDRWVASAPTAPERAARAQVQRPIPPSEPRPGSNAPAPAAPPRQAAPDKGRPPPTPPAGTAPGTTQPNLRTGVTWTWDGSRWQ
jgi:hypothetical protein